jgi:dimethylhistidine N-methyltransferase
LTVSKEDVAHDPANVTPGLIDDVRLGLGALGQKTLPSRYLYDEVGSTLFEAITFLDAYGLTRADARILSEHADAIARCAQQPALVAELGSGSGRKMRPLLHAIGAVAPTSYCPIDISRQAITYCRAEVGRIPGVHFHGIVADYFAGLRKVATQRKPGERVLALFVGSTIGNFDRGPAEAFLKEVRALLAKGDRLLLGMDLIKPEAQLLLAYDDPAGVTAAFSRNVLVRLNRELGADFDLAQFAHDARWNREARRVEMHLRSLRVQKVHLPGAGLEVTFREGETLWTESSHKFHPDEAEEIGRIAGFHKVGQWIDQEWPFAETMLEAE